MLVAARNEAERLASTLAALRRAFPAARVFVADDRSGDQTAEIARRAGAEVVRSEHGAGKGAAVTAAAERALERVAEESEHGARALFVLCDGDLGDSAAQLGALRDALLDGQAELAVAAFTQRLGGGLGVARAFAAWAIRRRCGVHSTAPISGQRALTEAALRDVLPLAHGYGVEVGMTIDAVRAGHRLMEVELDLSHRHSGRTPTGFAHRARQLVDFVRVYIARR